MFRLALPRLGFGGSTRTHVAHVGRVLVTRHPEGSEEGVREKRRRPAEHGSQRLWEKRERGEHVRESASDLPGTPERSMPRSVSRCTRSRFWVISFRMNRCRSRNRYPSNTDVGGFLDLSVSAAFSSVCKQYLIASCASSSNIAGCSHRHEYIVYGAMTQGRTFTNSWSCESTQTVF